MKICSGGDGNTWHEEIVCSEETCPLCMAMTEIFYKEEKILDLESELYDVDKEA